MRHYALTNKYNNMDKARSKVDGMLRLLGDRYTRYLPPSKYNSIVNGATENLYYSVHQARTATG